MCEQAADSGEHKCAAWRALEEIDKTKLGELMRDSVGFGVGVKSLNGDLLLEHIAGIVNPVLHGTDARGNPLPRFCAFKHAKHGRCTNQAHDGGFCTDHSDWRCTKCGGQATHTCDHINGKNGSVCDISFCDDHPCQSHLIYQI